MKRLYLLIIPILYIWIPVHSKTVHFSYDEAGNRIKREIIISKSNMPKKSTADVGRIEDDLCDKKVSITAGHANETIRIEISQFTSSDTVKLNIYDTAGYIIYHSDIVSESTEIFLNPIPSGIYILWIDINGKTQSYKLIKQ